MEKTELIIEIGTAELPPNLQSQLAESLKSRFEVFFNDHKIQYKTIKKFHSPQRIAIYCNELDSRQSNITQEKRGPSTAHAFQKDGSATMALLGFLKSQQKTLDDITVKTTNQGDYVVISTEIEGQTTFDLLSKNIAQIIEKIPCPRPMRWPQSKTPFARPVYWIMAKLGQQLIPFKAFGVNSKVETKGHRFHHPDYVHIASPNEYETELSKAFVIADAEKRKGIIKEQLTQCEQKIDAKVCNNPDLLNEVTALCEWPKAILCQFDENFLQLPNEVLITCLQKHQRAFALHQPGSPSKLLPYFITVANISSLHEQQVIKGNEKVTKARLADALFFFENDSKTALTDRFNDLKNITFQEGLGSMADKSERNSALAIDLYKAYTKNSTNDSINLEEEIKQASLLAKCDLCTEMVGEFPELQGIMGGYYSDANKNISTAITEQYLPKHAQDSLPNNITAICVALADKLDAWLGLVACGFKPKGDKDPYGLRRYALGIWRILAEKSIDINLSEPIKKAIKRLPVNTNDDDLQAELQSFLFERAKTWLKDKGYKPDEWQSINPQYTLNPFDFVRRIETAKSFKQQEAAPIIIAANKRIANLLKKGKWDNKVEVKAKLFELPQEHALNEIINSIHSNQDSSLEKNDYEQAVKCLLPAAPIVEEFFNSVMVNVDNIEIKNNRLALLYKIHSLFTRVFDISALNA